MQQQRATRRLRQLIAGVAVVALIAVVAGIVALIANQRARQTEAKAIESAKRAEHARKETADALAGVESEKAKAEAAERSARAAEEEGRKLLYTTDMQLVPFIWKDPMATLAQLRSRLNVHDPAQNPKLAGKDDLRGFEWHYYQHVLEKSAAVFSGHGVSVVDAALTSDGQLVTLDQNGRVRHWDLDSQKEDEGSRRDLPGGASAQVRALSANGRLAALAAGDKVHVFETSTGKATCSIDSAGSNPYRHLIFSRHGKWLVIVDNRIRWCNAETGELIASLDRKFDRVESIALSADGLTLAILGHDSGFRFSIIRLDPTAKKVAAVSGGSNGSPDPFSVCALSPDGQRLAIGEKQRGSLHGVITVPHSYNTWHGSAHAVPVSAMAFSGDGEKVATADTEGTIKIWDGRKLTSKSPSPDAGARPRTIQKYDQEPALVTLKGHQGPINSISFSSDGKRLITAGVDKTVRVWGLDNAGVAIRELDKSGWSYIARFSPDGQLIADIWDYGHKIILWDPTAGRRVRELPTSKKVVRVEFSPTDNRLMAVGYSGQEGLSSVALWDIDTGAEFALLPGAADAVAELEFSPDGKYLVGGFGAPDSVRVWEVATRRQIHRLNGHAGYCGSLDYSRDGTLLASGSPDGTAIIWSTDSWKATQTLRNPDKSPVLDVAFSPDGKTLAMATYRGNVQLWDVATGKHLETLKGHSSRVSSVAFSRDGRTLASGSYDQTVRLWNVQTRRELMQLDSGSVELGTVFRLSFSPDGKQLLAGGWHLGVWSTVPSIWNDADRAAETLRLLLASNADFSSRIRMLSENLRLHEALAKLDEKDVRVQAALAATRANWHASHQRWVEAAEEFDRLLALTPFPSPPGRGERGEGTKPETWLRTPGLLRLATALLHQNRPADAARLLHGSAKRRTQDGLPPIASVTGFGFKFAVEDGAVRITGLEPNSPASRSKLLSGDVIVKVNGVDPTKATTSNFGKMIEGNAGTKLRLTVRHPGGAQEDVDLLKENYRVDEATGELLFPLLAALEKRLAENPHDAGLLELHAELELAGQLDVAPPPKGKDGQK